MAKQIIVENCDTCPYQFEYGGACIHPEAGNGRGNMEIEWEIIKNKTIHPNCPLDDAKNISMADFEKVKHFFDELGIKYLALQGDLENQIWINGDDITNVHSLVLSFNPKGEFKGQEMA